MAIAPPLTLIFSGSSPSLSRQYTNWDANACRVRSCVSVSQHVLNRFELQASINDRKIRYLIYLKKINIIQFKPSSLDSGWNCNSWTDTHDSRINTHSSKSPTKPTAANVEKRKYFMLKKSQTQMVIVKQFNSTLGSPEISTQKKKSIYVAKRQLIFLIVSGRSAFLEKLWIMGSMLSLLDG